MLVRILQVTGLLCLLTAIVLGVLAGSLELRRSAEYYKTDEQGGERFGSTDTGVPSDRPDRTTATVDRLVTTAAPLFMLGVLVCVIAWKRQCPPERPFRRSSARYSAAKLCHEIERRRGSRRGSRRQRRSGGSADSAHSLPAIP